MADVQKEIALKVTTDTSQTQKAFKNAQQELEETRKALIDLALAGKQSSKEFKDLEQRAGAIQDAMGDVNARVQALANDTPKLQLLGEAARGIAAGFSIAQGAAAVFGDENEDLQKAILKTQGAMALLNGVQEVANLLNKDSALSVQAAALSQRAYALAVGASTGAMKAFRLALIATGVGAFVVAIGLLVTNWEKLTGAVTKFVDNSKALQNIIGFLVDGFTKLGRAIGIIPSESEKATQKMISDLEKQQALLEASGANTEAIQLRLAQLRVKLAKQTGKDIEKAEQDLTLVVAKQEAERFKIREAQRLKDLEAYRAYLERRKISNVEFDMAEMLQAQKTAADLLLVQQEQLNAELDAIFQANNVGFARQQEAAKARADLDKFYTDLRIADAERLEQARFQVASQAAGALSALSASIAEQGGKNAEKAFKLSKSLAIVQTTIDTIQAAQAAYKSLVGIPVVGAGLAIAAAAAATIAGIARINQIRKQQFNAPSSPTNVNTSVPSIGGAGGNTNVPQGFNPQTTNLGGFGQPTQNGGGGSNGFGKVVVVERDIRDVRNRVDSVERFATFG